MRATWPMLWLLPTIGGHRRDRLAHFRPRGCVACAAARRGRAAGLPSVQAGAASIITTSRSRCRCWSSPRRCGPTVRAGARWAAGALTGLALAVGLECLPYLMVCAAAFALRYVVTREGAQAAAHYGAALAASSVVGFLVIVAPAHWTRGVCDAIALNWVALVVIGGLGLAFAARCAFERAAVRAVCVGAAGSVATGVFLAIQPACLHGPYAMMDPAVWPIWLAHVREMQPLIPLMAKSPLTAIAIAAFPAAGAGRCAGAARPARASARLRLPRRDRRLRVGRDHDARCHQGLFVRDLARHAAGRRAGAASVFVAAAAHAGVALRARDAADAGGPVHRGDRHRERGRHRRARELQPAGARGLPQDRELCAARAPAGGADRRRHRFRPVPAGLTPHSVLAAPYHRLSTGIITAHEAFTAPSRCGAPNPGALAGRLCRHPAGPDRRPASPEKRSPPASGAGSRRATCRAGWSPFDSPVRLSPTASSRNPECYLVPRTRIFGGSVALARGNARPI